MSDLMGKIMMGNGMYIRNAKFMDDAERLRVAMTDNVGRFTLLMLISRFPPLEFTVMAEQIELPIRNSAERFIKRL